MNISENKDIKKTQEILMGILKAFDQVCRDNDIEYFLAGGTMLGAVRHEGFLPWDDDVDLYMKTSVWEKNKEIIRAALPAKYSLVCDEYNELYDNPVIRIIDNETTQISRSRISDKSPHGVLVDIFLLDPIPDDKEERQKYREDFWVYCEIKTPTMMLANPKVTISEEMERKYKHYLQRVEEEGRAAVVAEFEDKLFGINEDDCTDYHLRWGGYWVVAPIAAFREAKRVPFGEDLFPVAAGFPDVAFGEYGDTWMMIPDASAIWDHDTVQNYDVSYTVYDEAIEKEIDLDEYRQVQAKNKAYKIERLFLDSKLRRYYTKNMDAIARSILADDAPDKFIKMQKKLFKEHHLVAIDDDTLRDILYKTVIDGDWDFARGIKEFYQGDNASINEILSDVEAMRRVRASYFTGEGALNLAEAQTLLDKYPGQLHMMAMIAQLKAMDGDATEELGALIDEAINLHGKTPRLMKVAADFARNCGNSEQADAMYREIRETSRDGIVNLEIDKYFRKETV